MARTSGKTDEEKLLERIGAAIRAQRIGRDLSQEALADASRIDRSHMGKIERGERNVSILLLARIAQALGSPLAALLAAAEA